MPPARSLPRRTPAARTARARAAASFVLLVALTACGATPGTVDPSGVDGLVVPTPSPSPGDFVAEVDHRWAPLEPGSRWVYEVTGPEGTGERSVTVQETTTVAGVPVTPVRTRTTAPDGATDTVVRWYAQDRAGHLWLLGERDRWRVGEETDAAGLAVPEEPRRGDGYVAAAVPGVVEETVRVAETDASVTTPAGEYHDVVRLVVGRDGAEEHVHLAPGVGEVLRISAGGRERSVLVSYTVTG